MDRWNMKHSRSINLPRILTLLAGVLILKVTASVVLGYRDYFPPNFHADFLRGRESYFSGGYHWAFYVHILAGPVTLVLGLILISERFRLRFPKWHRSLGKTQGLLVLLLLTPSGLWMAYYAQTGPIAAIGFSVLAVFTATCVVFGWRSAVKRRFAEHRRWMLRCYLLLCSAVALRLIGGFVNVSELGTEWAYPMAAWVSWLVPLSAYEVSRAIKRQSKLGFIRRKSHSATFSLPSMEISARRVSAGVSSIRN
jgi:MFS family permease